MRNLVIVGLFLLTASTSSSLKTHSGAQAAPFQVSWLDKEWSMDSSCNAFSSLKDVTVPSTIIAAQIANEMRKPIQDRTFPLADPFYGLNLSTFDSTVYHRCPTVYSRQFTTSTDIKARGGSVILRLDGVNYNANVTVNGKQFISDRSIVGGIRRYEIDITSALLSSSSSRSAASFLINTNNEAEGDGIPPRRRAIHRGSRRGGGAINALAAGEEVVNELSISIQPPVNPRGTNLTFSFLDWNPLPADFNGGLWRSVSLLALEKPTLINIKRKSPNDSSSNDDDESRAVNLWSNGFAVTTNLAGNGTDVSLAQTVVFDLAIRCYPLENCESALITGTANTTAAAAATMIAENIVITTNYNATLAGHLALFRGAHGGCKVSTPFAKLGAAASLAVSSVSSPTSLSQKGVAAVFGQPVIEGRIACTVRNVKEPLLWYPFRRAFDPTTGASTPNQFQMTVNFNTNPTLPAPISGEDFYPISEEKKFGLRQIVSNVSSAGSRQLFINNEFTMITGAGWSPDLFLRIDEGEVIPTNGQSYTETYKGRLLRQLQLTKEMGVNVIRLEGKWENDLFFNLCDELGIMVIPGIECCSSWQNWNLWDETLTEIARISITDQIRRIGSHPSVVSFFTSSDEIAPPAVEQMYVDIYKKERWSGGVFPAACAGTSTISGPTGVKMSGPYSWVPPNYFLDNTDGSKYKLGGGWGFLTEGGPGEAPMTYNAWKMTVPADKMWETKNPDPSGDTYYDPSLSEWWNAHAGLPKGKFGTLIRFTKALNARFGAASSAKEYLYKAQLTNYEGIRAMFEAYTRNKIYNATGVVQWMLNNAHPSNIWHLYDYYLMVGGGYFGAKAALRPINLVLDYQHGSVAVVSNDFNNHFGYKKGTAKRELSAEWFVYRLPKDTPENPMGSAAPPIIMASSGAEMFDVNAFGHNTVKFMQNRINFTAVHEDLDVNETCMVRLVYIVQSDAKVQGGSVSSSAAAAAVVGGGAVSDDLTSRRVVEDNWYWLSTRRDIVDWDYKGPSPHLWTDCLQWADFTSLAKTSLAKVSPSSSSSSSSTDLPPITVSYTSKGKDSSNDMCLYEVTLTSNVNFLLFGVQVAAYSNQKEGEAEAAEIAPSFWSDNYFMMMPKAERTLLLKVLCDFSVGSIEAVTYNQILGEKSPQ